MEYGGGGHAVEKQRLSGEMTKTVWELHVVSKMQVSWHTAAQRSLEQHWHSRGGLSDRNVFYDGAVLVCELGGDFKEPNNIISQLIGVLLYFGLMNDFI